MSLIEGQGSWTNEGHAAVSDFLSKADIKSAAQALALLDVSPKIPLADTPIVHNDAFWDLKLMFAKDAKERRGIRRKRRRHTRYAKIGARIGAKTPRSSVYFCGACGACGNWQDARPTELCPCVTTGIQATMSFEPKVTVGSHPNDFITFDVITFDDLVDGGPIDILKTEYIDAAVA